MDALRDYVPLGELEVGTVLHVQGGGEAILVSKTWRQGEFEVFDFEVEGLHNFYVRSEGSDAAGVLVHNSTKRVPGDLPGGGKPTGGGPEQVATENGAVAVKGENYNLVGNGTDDFVQLHSKPDHNGVGASSGIDFHTHKPELQLSPDGKVSNVKRPATPTTGLTSMPQTRVYGQGHWFQARREVGR